MVYHLTQVKLTFVRIQIFYVYLSANASNCIELKLGSIYLNTQTASYLCSFELCCLNAFRDLVVFPQTLQVWDTPVMWWASMWSFIRFICPSLPQTLQILDIFFELPLFKCFCPTSIIDLILSSCRSGATV